MNIPLLIVIAYIIALFLISAYAKKLAKNTEGFVLAGRNLTTLLVAVSITGLAIGGASTVGVAEQAFNVGLSAGWYNVAWGAGAIVMGLVAAAKYRSLNVTTVPELFEKFYDVKGRIICVISQIIILLTITSLQYLAGGAILASMLPDVFTLQTGMITSALVFIGITFVGGMWSAGLSNVLNVILIYLGITLAAIVTVVKQGGLGTIALQLPPEVPYFNWVGGLGWLTIASWFAVMITQSLSAQSIVQIACGAKDAKTARNGFVLGGLLMLPIGFLAALMGIAAKAVYPDVNATLALPQIIMSLHPAVAGITLAALWAADVSTAGCLLLGSATLFSQDIYKRFIKPNTDEKSLMKITRLSVALLGVITFILAMSVSGILQTLTVGLSLTTAFTVVFLFTVFAPKLARKNSAFCTVLVSLVILALWLFVPGFKALPIIRALPHVIYLEWIACVATYLVVPLFDRQRVYVDAQTFQAAK